jgi:NADPH:quinone reductase-like Zn-dependent oxidoreductase
MLIWAMKAAVYGRSDVVIEEIEKPTPADDEVLIKVRSASINAPDWRLMSVNPLVRRLIFAIGKRRVARPGIDVAGVVEMAGKNVTQFKPGDAVFGCCAGSLAEYACGLESSLLAKPDGLTFEQAACVGVAGLTALQGLRDKAKVQRGQKVLINGGAGGVGTFAVQIAKSLGAEVTAVCSSGNVEMVRSIGADRVIDYTKEDFAAETERYDVIFDNVGNRSLSECRRVLSADGRFVMVGGPKSMWGAASRALSVFLFSRLSRRFTTLMARLRKDDLAVLADLMKTEKITPMIDRQYALGEVAQALQYVSRGHARAKVVITP